MHHNDVNDAKSKPLKHALQKIALLFIVWAQIFRMIFEDMRRPSEEASMSEHLEPDRF
jgi:prolipoprotein diacylglyceryltransferase